MSRIIAAVDFSDVSELVIQEALTLGNSLKVLVTVLHVNFRAPIVSGNPMLSIPPSSYEGGISEEKARAGLSVCLKSVAKRLDIENADADICVVEGSAVENILKYARENHASRIVLGSHGHGALYHLLLGSVSRGVIRDAPCPVLIVPSKPGSHDTNLP